MQVHDISHVASLLPAYLDQYDAVCNMQQVWHVVSYAAVKPWEQDIAFSSGLQTQIIGATKVERTNAFVNVHEPVVFSDGRKALYQLTFTRIGWINNSRPEIRQKWSHALVVSCKPGPAVSNKQINMLSACGVLLIRLQSSRVAVLHFPDTPDSAAQQCGNGKSSICV